MKTGIYVLNDGSEVTESSDTHPEVILIGTIIDDEFVGSVIANSCDKECCESLVYSGEKGNMTGWETFGLYEGEGEEGDDLCDLMESEYPELSKEIERLRDKFFIMDGDMVMYKVSSSITDDVRLSKQFEGCHIDIEDVRKSNGTTIGEYIEL